MQTQFQRAFVRSGAVMRRAGRHFRHVLSRYIQAPLVAPLFTGIVTTFALSDVSAQTTTFNYAEALQKSLYFYDAEKSGPGITGGRLEWRGDSEVADRRLALVPKGAGNVGTNMSQAFINANRAALDPDGDGFVDVSGGFHDAGDHVRFGLPQSYAVSTLAWGFFEFPEAFVQSEQRDHMVELLRWAGDCFLRSTFRDASGNVVAFCYQVGEGAVDHTIWAPPELLTPALIPRPAYFATAETPASDQVAGHAAALAAIGAVLKTIDPVYSARCIETARALYRFAVAHRGLGYSGGFYGSSYDEDELSWAAVWLLTATGEPQFLADIEATSGTQYTGYLSRIIKSTADTWQNIWVHSWDTVWGGVFARLAALTTNERYMYYARWNVEFWSGVPHLDPTDHTFLTPSPAGFRVITTWGSARYNCAAQLCALVMRKLTGRPEFSDWARGQMNYIMGNNPLNRSYIVGFPTPAASVQHPHHRAAHGSTTNSQENPTTHRHVLWGALAGGPDIMDFHNDATTDFVYNEVAVDYNAGLVGALAGLYTYYGAGQKPLANFPPLEPAGQPYLAEAKLEQENTERSQVSIRGTSVLVHPPQFERGLSARYFFNISELLAAGQTIADVRVEVYYDQEKTVSGRPVVVRGPTAWDGGAVYYVEFDWTGAEIVGPRDIQFGLIARQDAQFRSNWNPANDWSHTGLTSALVANPRVPLYHNGTLVYGQEPPRSVTENFSLLANPASVTINRGATATTSITIARSGGFTGAVDLTVTGLPTGVTASIAAPTTANAPATLTLTAAATATLGNATLTITGTGTPGTRTAVVSLTVAQPTVGDFSLSATPSTLTVQPGTSTTIAIAIARVGGFTGPVTLTATGLPPGVTASFVPSPATGTISTLTLSAASVAGTFPITITGTGTPGARSAAVTLTVAPVPVVDFSLAATPASVTINRGGTATSTVAVTRTGGFSGSVTLAASGLPAGVTAAFSPNPTAGAASALTLTASPTATLGAANVTLSGTGGPGIRTSALSVTVADTNTSQPCTTTTAATLPLVRNGVGDVCFAVTGNVTFINSWNMQRVEINGVDFTNKWANALPPKINGGYIVRYVANVPWAHLEVNGTP